MVTISRHPSDALRVSVPTSDARREDEGGERGRGGAGKNEMQAVISENRLGQATCMHAPSVSSNKQNRRCIPLGAMQEGG